MPEHHCPLRLWVPAEHGDGCREILRILYDGRTVLLCIVPHLQRSLAAADSETRVVVVTPPNADRRFLDSRRQNSDGALLRNPPDEDVEIGARTGENVRVGGVPADGGDGLLVLGHDGQEAEFLETAVQLRNIESVNCYALEPSFKDHLRTKQKWP